MKIQAILAALASLSILLIVSVPAVADTEAVSEEVTDSSRQVSIRHRANYRNKKGFGAPTAINVQLDKDDEVKDPIFRPYGRHPVE